VFTDVIFIQEDKFSNSYFLKNLNIDLIKTVVDNKNSFIIDEKISFDIEKVKEKVYQFLYQFLKKEIL
jgi:hypothetical protein